MHATTDLPNELWAHILGPCLGRTWRFCARPVCRLWHGICCSLRGEGAAVGGGDEALRVATRLNTDVATLSASGRLVFASKLARFFASTCGRDADAAAVERSLLAMGATSAQAAAIMVATNVLPLVDHAISSERAYAMHDPCNAHVTRLVLERCSFHRVGDYLDAHPPVAIDMEEARKCRHVAMFALDRGGSRRRRIDVKWTTLNAPDGDVPLSQRDSLLHFLSIHNAHDRQHDAIRRLWELLAPVSSAADALAYLRVACRRGLESLQRADKIIAEYGPMPEPHHVVHVVASTPRLFEGRDAGTRVLSWLYEESMLLAPLRPMKRLDADNCALAHPDCLLCGAVCESLIVYACERFPTSVETIASLFVKMWTRIHAYGSFDDNDGDTPSPTRDDTRRLDICVTFIAPGGRPIDPSIPDRIGARALMASTRCCAAQGGAPCGGRLAHCPLYRLAADRCARESLLGDAWRCLFFHDAAAE